MNSVLNVSAYRFCAVPDPHALREALLERARFLQLKGTILLASEGINLFLAGAPDAVRSFVAALQMEPKESWSATQPYRKLLVKVKREIIRMDHPAVQPAQGRAPALDAATAKRWLDQGHDDAGRPVVTLDTRNAFEVDYGTFEGAVDWRLAKFSDFPG
ncbi:MAG TPA: sulfurtransferase, partial [Ramlibacter sp.]